MSTFKDILKFTLAWEGGFVNDPADLGGATYRGITQRTYDAYRAYIGAPKRSVASLTIRETEEIYLKQYWSMCRCDDMPPALALVVFDTAVNRGVSNASKMLQKLVGAKEDGVIGLNTLHAVGDFIAPGTSLSVRYICDRYIDARETHHKLRALTRPTQWKFLKGWLNRTAALRAEARRLSL